MKTHQEKAFSETVMEYLGELLEKWAPRFGLQDWVIRIELNRFDRMNDGNALATVNFNHIKKSASIRVLDPRDWPEDVQVRQFDLEEYVVHELTHILVGPMEVKELPTDVLEQSVEDLVRVILRTDRSKTRGRWKNILRDAARITCGDAIEGGPTEGKCSCKRR